MAAETPLGDEGQSRSARRRLRSRAYLPLVLLAAVQGLYILVAPSVTVRESELGQVTAGPGGSGGSSPDGSPAFGGEAASGPIGTGSVGGGGGSSDSGGASSGGGPAGPGRSSNPGAPSPGAPRPGVTGGGDRSHCTKAGRQHGMFTFQQEAAACVPKWPAGADNGGSTYQGVTREKIKVVIFEEQPNEQIDTILAAQDLSMTEDDRVRIHKYGQAFVNKYFERYGRQVEFIRFKSACPITPPSLVQCKAEARKVIDMKPFAVLFGMSAYPELFDEWTRAGIVALGGWNWADSYFTERRPFRYEVFMTGTRGANHVIEYYCKKMAKKAASNSGTLIHRDIGTRSTPRKLGIIANEVPAFAEAARYIAREISKCDGSRYTPEVVTYVGDIDRAAEIQEAVSSKMINSKTTTVLCWCGPLEMTGFSKNFTAQQYYPEHLLPGIGLSDVDVLARLYDPAQWIHAFGPSHVADSRPKNQSQGAAVYKEAGDSANHTAGADLYWLYLDLVAQGIQFAGPRLTPLTFEAGLLSSPGTGGGDPKSALWDWGPGDYGGYGDVREVFYDPAYESTFDGVRGGYRVLNNSRRFLLGQWSTVFAVPPAAS